MRHIFKYQLKINLRRKEIFYWMLVFPLVMVTILKFSFYSVGKVQAIEFMSVGVVSNASDSNFVEILRNLKRNDKNLIEVQEYFSETSAKEALNKGQIEAYYILGKEDISIVVDNFETEELFLENLAKSYLENRKIAKGLVENNYPALELAILKDLQKDINHFGSKQTKESNSTAISYYAFIGLLCFYSANYGAFQMQESEANLSTRACRIAMAPINKFKYLVSSITAVTLIQSFNVFVLIIYMKYILRINFGYRLMSIYLLLFLGIIAGISFGMCAYTYLRTKPHMKMNLISLAAIIFSVLAGMIISDIKYYIATNLPVLGYINPVNMISDGLYSLYFFENNSRYISSLLCLTIFSVVCILLTYRVIRRRKYDSI